jgi:hypothetical protein
MAIVPNEPNALLTRRDAAAALTAAGYPTAASTLATLTSRPGRTPSPIYQLYGSRVVYRWGNLLEWAQSRLSNPLRSTSEADAA